MKTSQGLLISDPHNMAWLFNFRGADVSYTPLPLVSPIRRLTDARSFFSTGESLRRRAGTVSPDTRKPKEPDALPAFVQT